MSLLRCFEVFWCGVALFLPSIFSVLVFALGFGDSLTIPLGSLGFSRVWLAIFGGFLLLFLLGPALFNLDGRRAC